MVTSCMSHLRVFSILAHRKQLLVDFLVVHTVTAPGGSNRYPVARKCFGQLYWLQQEVQETSQV